MHRERAQQQSQEERDLGGHAGILFAAAVVANGREDGDAADGDGNQQFAAKQYGDGSRQGDHSKGAQARFDACRAPSFAAFTLNADQQTDAHGDTEAVPGLFVDGNHGKPGAMRPVGLMQIAPVVRKNGRRMPRFRACTFAGIRAGCNRRRCAANGR